MSNTALKAISVTIGVFFIFFGLLKISLVFSEQLYKEIRKAFFRYASVFPFRTWTGWTPNAHTIRRVYGGVEIISGVVMVTSQGLLCDLSNCSLLGLILYSLYNCWALDEGMKEASHSIVLGLVLTCRFVIRLQAQQQKPLQTANDDEAVRKALRDELKRRMEVLHRSMAEVDGVLGGSPCRLHCEPAAKATHLHQRRPSPARSTEAPDSTTVAAAVAHMETEVKEDKKNK
ncbi:DoxX-like [Sparganum proliferum]